MTWTNVLVGMGITSVGLIVLNFIAIIKEKHERREINWEQYYKTNLMIFAVTLIGLILAHFGISGRSYGMPE